MNPKTVVITKYEYDKLRKDLADAIVGCHEREAEIERLNRYIDRLENTDWPARVKQMEAKLWAAECRANNAIRQRDDLIDELDGRVRRAWSVIPTRAECEELLRQLGPYIIENFDNETNFIIQDP